MFFVELVHAEFKIDLKLGEETEKIEVIRWQFPLLHGMLRTAYDKLEAKAASTLERLQSWPVYDALQAS